MCIVGPLTGHNAGWVVSQGEVLAERLSRAGHRVVASSAAPGRVRRLAEIARTIHRHRADADLLLVQTYGGPSFVVEDVASALGRLLGYRVIFHLHGGALPAFIARYPRWSRRVLARAAACVAPSPYLARALTDAGVAAAVIPNVVDVAYRFRRREQVRPRLLWMRSFHPLYDPLLAVAVLRRVRATHPDATLVMAGQDKGMEARVRHEVARLGLTDAVRFPGFLDARAKAAEGEAADIFLNTTRVDNTPVAVLEAAAMGLPVVATDVGGLRDLLDDGAAGELVPAGDADAMAAAVLRLVSEPARAARLSMAGRAVARRFAWGAAGPRWEARFAQLRAAPRPPGGR